MSERGSVTERQLQRSRKSLSNISRTSSKNTVADANKEIIFKMSKKIAQLTKVVYYLNTKNEDGGQALKSIVNNYESELNDTIKDGASIIHELQLKLMDSEAKLELQQGILKQNVETIMSLEEKVERSEMHLLKAKEIAAQELIKEKSISATKLEQRVQSLHEMQEEVERENFSVSEQHKLDIETLKAQYDQELKDALEEGLTESSKLKGKIRSLEGQIEDLENERAKNNQEMAEVRTLYDTREEKLKQEFDVMMQRVRANLEAETASNEEKTQNIVVLNIQLDKKTETVEKLEAFKFDMEIAKRKLEDDIENWENQFNMMKMEYKFSKETCAFYEDKLPKLERELTDTVSKLTELQGDHFLLERKHENMKADFESTKEVLQNTRSNLSGATEEIVRLNDKVEDMQGVSNEQLTTIENFKQKIVDDHENHLSTMEYRLNELKIKMEKEREEEVLRRSEEGLRKKESIIYYLNKDIENLKLRLTEIEDENLKNVEENNRKHLAAERVLQAKIDESENNNTTKQNKIKELKDVIDEKSKSILDHMGTIKTKDNEIKSLEVDLADMFQKMVQVDKQVREELNEKFENDVNEMKLTWNEQHLLEIENQRAQLDTKFNSELTDILSKVKSQNDEEIKQLHEIYSLKIAGHTEELLGKQKQLAACGRDIDELEYRIKEQIAEFERKEKLSLDTFNERNEAVKKEHEEQLEDLRKKSKGTLEESIHTIETKFEVERADLAASHKKQVDDLRTFFSTSTISLKKDAEATRLNDLKQLQLQHDNEISILKQNHKDELSNRISQLSESKELEISDLVDEYENRITNLRLDLEDCNGKLRDLTGVEDRLRNDHEALKVELESKKQEQYRKEKEIRKAGKEFENRVVKLHDEFAVRLKNHSDQLKSDHISEMQVMLQEFEKAKNYLKTEIALKNQHLEDAALKYVNREPRDQDLQTIANLHQDIDNHKKHIAELNNQLNNFSLELNNRETSFNKIFNNAPFVGILHPSSKTKEFRPNLLGKKPSNQKLPPLSLLTAEERAKSALTMG